MAELRVGIKADVSEARVFTRALKDIKAAATGTASSLSATTAAASGTSVALSTTVSASGALASSQNLVSVANVAVSRTLASVAARAAETAAAETATVTATGRLQAAFVSLGATAKGVFTSIQVGSTRMLKQMQTAAAATIGIGTAGVGLGAALAVGLGVGIKGAVDFEKSMSRIEGLVGVAKSEVEGFEKPLLEIGKATAKGPNELAEALFFITSAGAKGQDALDILEASAKAASAGLGETKEVADAVTSAMNAYGKENLSAAKSTDILVASVREGKAAANEIAGAIGQVLPIASQLDVTFDQVGATIAALTRVGLNAAEASTALKATLNTISKPGNEAISTLKKLSVENLGVEKTFDDVRNVLKEDGLIAALNLLQDATGNNTQELQKIFPNIRAGAGVFSLLGKNAKEVEEIFKRMTDTTGATDAAFEAFKNTTSFELGQALVVLQISLQKIGKDLLPAVAKAFVWLATAVEKTVAGFHGLGEAIAEALHGSDDAYIRAIDRQKELNDAVKNLTLGHEIVVGFDELGRPIKKRLGEIGEMDKKLVALQNGFFGIADIELEGTFDEQLATLVKARDEQDKIVSAMEKEKFVRDTANRALQDTAGILEEIVVTSKKREKVIDLELLDKGKKSLRDLKDEVSFLKSDLSNLQELGKDGIGLAEDVFETNEIMRQLQGQLGVTSEKVRKLVKDKRDLTDAINDINEAFIKQEEATEFLDDLRKSTADVAEAFAFVRAGGALIDIEATQQARQILADLGEGTTETLESIKASIIASQAWNDALSAIPVNKVDALKTALIAIQDLQAATPTEDSAYAVLGQQATDLGQALIDAQLQAAGLGTATQIMFDTLPKAEQFAQIRQDIFDAFDLAGIVDPESNPQFIAAIEALQKKMFDTTDFFKEFAIQAARNVQSAFADFLFDPFSNGLDGLLADFTETLKRMASELLSQQLLKSFFSAIGGGGGGILDTIAGQFAEGGNVQAGKPILVGEKGPEIITPRQSGTVIPNDMLGGKQQAPQVSVGGPTIVNTIDDAAIVGAFNRGGGNSVVLNNMTENQSSYRNALGIQ